MLSCPLSKTSNICWSDPRESGREPAECHLRPCPADILGYLLTHADAEAFDLEEWLPRVKIALRKLDLIVFLPIEKPDRIVLPLSQDAAYRLRVDEELQEIILGGSFDFEVDVLEVTGSPQARLERVLSHIRNGS